METSKFAMRSEIQTNAHTLEKSMASVFWDSECVILVFPMKRETTINGEQYRNTLTRLRSAIKSKWPGKLSRKVLFLYDNARLHIAHDTVALIKKFGWKIVPRPPWNPDIAPQRLPFAPTFEDWAWRREIRNGKWTTKFRPRICTSEIQGRNFKVNLRIR